MTHNEYIRQCASLHARKQPVSASDADSYAAAHRVDEHALELFRIAHETSVSLAHDEGLTPWEWSQKTEVSRQSAAASTANLC